MLIEEPKFYFAYRGGWYGPFEDINAAYAKYRLKADSRWHPHCYDKRYWYQYHVVYGIPTIRGRELVSFDYFPKPFMRELHVAQCRCCHRVTDETILYPEGRSV